MNRKPTVILHRKRFNVLQTLLFYQVFQIRNTSESPQNKKSLRPVGAVFFIPVKKNVRKQGETKKNFFSRQLLQQKLQVAVEVFVADIYQIHSAWNTTFNWMFNFCKFIFVYKSEEYESTVSGIQKDIPFSQEHPDLLFVLKQLVNKKNQTAPVSKPVSD